MRKIAGLRGRAAQRGKKLDEDCRRAQKLTHEYGENDTRVFCSGLRYSEDDDYCSKCIECGAFYLNATPQTSEIL